MGASIAAVGLVTDGFSLRVYSMPSRFIPCGVVVRRSLLQFSLMGAALCSFKPSSSTEVWGVVLPQSEAAVVKTHCSRSFPSGLSGYWAPSDRELVPLEQKLKQLIPKAIPPRRNQEGERDPLGYRLQYIGYYRNNLRVIYINAFDESFADMPGFEFHWTRHYAWICDAGSDTFGIVYVPETGLFDTLDVDGEMDVGPRIDISTLQ